MAESAPTIHYHKGDLPADVDFGSSVAVDSETMGLINRRDRLCVVQLSSGDGTAHVVHLNRDYQAPNLCKVLTDPAVVKIFHFARFDVAAFEFWLGVVTTPIYCTKIASKLTRTNTERHGLKNLLQEYLSIDISKQQQSSDWGADELNKEQLLYAASDVLYLHQLKARLDGLLAREGRVEMAQACFDFLPTRAKMDLLGWENEVLDH